MRKVILGLAVSLDGFIEGPGGEYDWCFTDQDYGMSSFFKRIDSIFMGRKSYEMAQNMEGESPWKGVITYVFSRSIKEVNGKDIRLVTGTLAEEVATIKKEKGKDIWLFGGAALTTSFINEKLVDELWLSVHPILLGSGKPLFHQIDGRKKLKLLECTRYETGLVSLKYAME